MGMIKRNLFHWILGALNLLSVIILLTVVFGIIPMIPCGNMTTERSELINDFLKDCAIGVIASTFFYYLVVVCIDRTRRKKILAYNQGRINLVLTSMQRVFAYYADKLQLHDVDSRLLNIPSSAFDTVQSPNNNSVQFKCREVGSNGLSVFKGSTEVCLIHGFVEDATRISHFLSESYLLNTADENLIIILDEISTGKFKSDTDIVYGLRGMSATVDQYSSGLKKYYELFVALAKYGEVKEIEYGDNLQSLNTTQTPIPIHMT